MSIESATYISQLNASNPTSSDYIGEGDNHIRLIKAVLKNTFPNATGPFSGGFVPTGGILMWHGLISTIPSGWGLCNGNTYAKVDGSGNITTPNLMDKFIMSRGPVFNELTTGGAFSFTPTITVNSTALTTANLPSHSHTITDPGHNHSASQPPHTHDLGPSVGTYGLTAGGTLALAVTGGFIPTTAAQPSITVSSHTTGITGTGNTGSGSPHTHTATCSAVSTLPTYYALAFIMRL